MRSGIRQYWFLGALLLVLACGFWLPGWLRPLANVPHLPDLLVAGVLFLTALPHDFSALRRMVGRPGPPLLAIAMNSVLIPLLAWPLSSWLPPPFRLGLIVAASVPSTIVSATVWTRRAGGNDLIPIVVTAATNLSCVAVSPFWIWLFAGRQTVALDLHQMVTRLTWLVLLPILAAQLARQWAKVAKEVTAHRVALGIVSQLGILTMIGVGIVQTGDRLPPGWEDGLSLLAWLQMGGAVLGLHLSAAGAGWWLGRWLGFDRADVIAISLAGSQKTLMIGLHLAISIGGHLILMPIIAYHVLQLVADTLLADWWRRRSP